MRRFLLLPLLLVLGLFGATATAKGDSIGPITFEPPTYGLGNINLQDGWMKTGPFDVAVGDVSLFADASGYGFGTQALRSSNAVTSGSFGNQTFSPGLVSPAGEAGSETRFEASFSIGTTQATQQSGLFLSASPDSGDGSRMSYLSFADGPTGIDVVFYDATNPGPLGTVASFNPTALGTLSRSTAHLIGFSIDFVPGPANDVVKIYIDGVLSHTGTTWEDYYRYDPEQNGNGNQVPVTNKMLFRNSGPSAPANAGQGYLIDGVSLSSSSPVGPPTSKDDCKKGGWATFDAPRTFKNQGDCVSFVASGK